MRKFDFLIAYALARAAVVPNDIDVDRVFKDAIRTWSLIFSEVGDQKCE